MGRRPRAQVTSFRVADDPDKAGEATSESRAFYCQVAVTGICRDYGSGCVAGSGYSRLGSHCGPRRSELGTRNKRALGA